MPTLSKSANRTPLRPRVAAAGTPLTATTPLQRNKSTTPAVSSRDGVATPFLSNNITPRSGKRNSRVDSTNTTPTGTPSGVPSSPADELFRIAQDTPIYGLGASERDNTKRPMVSFSTAGSEVGYSKPSIQASADSKFFFASEAKTGPPPRPQLPPKSSASFVYANGVTETIAAPQSSSASAVGSTVGEDRSQPKFFRANGTPDLQPSPILLVQPPKRPGSTISTSSRMASPMLAHQNALSPPQRPISPTKPAQVTPLSSSRPIPNLASPLISRPQQVGRGQSANTIVVARRASIETSQKIATHGRSASVSSPDPSIPARRISSGSSFEPLSPTPLVSALNSPLISTSENTQEDGETESDTLSELQSPIKAGHSLERMNELAADARRERKVLDLEITNSSLEAINRTLEREMRKQTAELRRYRRLSRSGRLSITASGSRRTSGDSLSMIEGEQGTMLSDMSEEEEESDEESDVSESDSLEDGTLSPKAMAESDLRHRKRDEKRLQLDLSKHQQLLTDSQRMNQSLKRCLGWTEELINEGKKALAYNVKVSDVALGGRVLLPEELEEAEDNEGMSPVGYSLLKQARLAASAAWGGEERDDRDSGIELDGPQRTPTDTFEYLPQ